MLGRLILLGALCTGCSNESSAQSSIETGKIPLIVQVHSGYTAFDTDYGSELVNSVLITKGNFQYLTLYSVQLIEIQAGDILQYSSQGQITNDAGITALLGARADLGTSPLPADRIYQIGLVTGYNVTPEMHHAPLPPMTHSGYVFQTSYSSVYLNIVVYSGSTDSNNLQYLNVNLGHGRLSGLVIRPQP